MSIPFASDAWITALSEHLNSSSSYERSANDWEGDFTFVIEADDVFPKTVFLFLGLFHGKSTDAKAIATLDEQVSDYKIRAPYATWRRVVEGKLDPIQGMMMRKLKLRGNLTKIMRYPRAAKEIVSCCALIPTDWD